MKVYFKKHKREFNEVCAACDEDLIGKKIICGELEVDVSERFYKGDLMDIDEAIMLLDKSNNINLIGEHIIEAAIKKGMISPKAVIMIGEIPYTMKFFV